MSTHTMTTRILEGEKVILSPSLSGQDSDFNALTSLWEQMQLSVYEPASQPEADLVSFADTAEYFGVIQRKPTPSKQPASSQSQSSSSKMEKPPLHELYPDKPDRLGLKAIPSESRPLSKDLEALRMHDDEAKGDSDTNPNDEESPFILEDETVEEQRDWLVATWTAQEQTPSRIYGGPVPNLEPIGLVYLIASPLSTAPAGQLPELNLGIIVNEKHHGKGYAREAVELVVSHAFKSLNAHRLQATLIAGSAKDRITSILTQLWFAHEGVARGAFYHPFLAEWQDITRFGLVDTQWAMRGYWNPAPKSLWDELLMRHERERAQLLQWEERNGKIRRSASAETLRISSSIADAAVSEKAGSTSGFETDQEDSLLQRVEAWNVTVSHAERVPRDVASVSSGSRGSRRSPSLASTDSNNSESKTESSFSVVSDPAMAYAPATGTDEWDDSDEELWEDSLSQGGDSDSEGGE
ncbi:Spermidine n1-acetyltransferase [Mycena chlorophos]|uniref:Spermidine n1-acetyltransferase n=1 Tax=Mycena chlorophos TaxID=658473 RepID=A0A8H6SLS5_MYCCL|nr:Spermidine n1-acetyltransferase [Mycena chlorophos]